MAFTKAPEYNTHQLTKVSVDQSKAFVNSAEAWSYRSNYVNCYLDKDANGVSFVQLFPGYIERALVTRADTNSCRALFVPNANYSNYTPLIVYGRDIVTTNTSTSFLTKQTNLFLAADILYRVGFTEYKYGSTYYVACVETGLTGGTGYVHLMDATAGTVSYSSAVSGRLVPDIVFIDGYLIVANSEFNNGAQRVFFSSIGAPQTWNTSTDYLDAEMDADIIRGLAKHHNHLVVFGSRTTEFYYNAGNAVGSPFSRQSNYATRVGLAYDGIGTLARNQHQTIDDITYFIGVTDNGVRGFYKLENFKITKISTNIIDEILNQGTSERSPYIASLKLELTDRGVCPALMNTGPSPTTMVYIPHTDSWAELSGYEWLWSHPTESGLYMITQSGATSRLSARILGTAVSSDLVYESATLYFPLHGIGDNSYKHIKYVDLIVGGSPTQVTYAGLLYEKGKFIGTSSVSAGTPRLLSNLYPNRWRNLGRGRDYTLQFTFTNLIQMRVYGVEVAWNAGTH